jgi:hypothetical protein
MAKIRAKLEILHGLKDMIDKEVRIKYQTILLDTIIKPGRSE